MKKSRKYIKIIILVIAFIIYLLAVFNKYNKYRYMWLFKDNIRKNIDTISAPIGLVRDKDLYYFYGYCKTYKQPFIEKDTVYAYFIEFWEFKDLGEINLNNILIKSNKCFFNENFKLFSEHLNPDWRLSNIPLVTSKLNFEFKNKKMDVNIDDNAEVYKVINTNNYKGFFGRINKMSFSDTNGDVLIQFNYKNANRTLFLMYKVQNSFFVIMVNCDYENLMDENVINMFNLK